MKDENLMVVPETADDFRAAVSALRSLDASKGVSFHRLIHETGYRRVRPDRKVRGTEV
jgi:hypothetical protein